MFAALSIAATTWDGSWPRFDQLWVGDTSDTPTNTLSTNSTYIKGDLEVDGTIYADGGVSGATRSIPLDLSAAIIDTAGTQTVMGNDGSTAPGIAATDGIPAIVYASSAETASIGWTFELPADYSTSLSFRMMMSSDSATNYASLAWDWSVFVNHSDTAFDAAAYDQTRVTNSNGSIDVSNALQTFTVNATALADMSAGDMVSVFIWPIDVRGNATTEVKNVAGRYTPTY